MHLYVCKYLTDRARSKVKGCDVNVQVIANKLREVCYAHREHPCASGNPFEFCDTVPQTDLVDELQPRVVEYQDAAEVVRPLARDASVLRNNGFLFHRRVV